MDGEFSRAEMVNLLIRMVLLGSVTVWTLKYMMNIIDPTNKQKKDAQKRAQAMFAKLKITNVSSLNEYELMVASQLIDPQTIDIAWGDIGGLDKVIKGIIREVILPIKAPQSFTPPLRPPKGVLLHGPPGCGKTMLAKATAKAAGARFINLEVAMLTDKWYGESQKLAKAVFTLAKKLQPCIIFIDEIDSFLRSRDSHDHEATAMVKAQFMTLWDGLETANDNQVIVLGATNRPRDVDPAFLRRMPDMYAIGIPDAQRRREILNRMIEPGTLDPTVDLDRIAEQTDGFSGSDLREMYRAASMIRAEEYITCHPELFGLTGNGNDNSVNIQSSSASSSSSTDNFSLVNGGDCQARLITMDDYSSVIRKMIENKHQTGIGNGQSVIGID